MTLMGICERCVEKKPIHVPHERRHLTRGPDGEKLCPRHAKRAWREHDGVGSSSTDIDRTEGSE